jgi:glutathione peroxidase
MASNEAPKTIYDFNVKNIDGEAVSLEKYKGKPVLVVNVGKN